MEHDFYQNNAETGQEQQGREEQPVNYYERYRGMPDDAAGAADGRQTEGYGRSGEGVYSAGDRNGFYGDGPQSGAPEEGWQNGPWSGGQPQDGSRGGSGRNRNARRKGSGWKIAVGVTLAVVFVGFCGYISWLAVESVQSQMAGRREAEPAAQESIEQPTGPGEEIAGQSGGTAPEAAGAPAGQTEPVPSASAPVRGGGSVTTVVTDVTAVVESVMPACVSVTNNFTEQVQDFWGQTYSRDGQGSGSGIIIGQNETELLIVSNNHVIDSADSLQVQFIDGAVAEAQVKGTDPVVDLAVIAVKLEEIGAGTRDAIVVAQMGDSDNLKIGEPAIAIGNALGYGQSVTTGVISALNRTLEVSETGTSSTMIQTDAAINPGNSGGALLNINGEVIGINSSKNYGSAIEGMGYAIPISTARPIIEELMTHETRSRYSDEDRGYLGISCINVTSELSANFDLPEGIFVAQVYEDTGADRAGLKRGDIITAFDGVEVHNQEELNGQMQYFKAGETAEITVMRNTGNGYQASRIEIVLSSLQQLNESSREEETQPRGWGGQLWP